MRSYSSREVLLKEGLCGTNEKKLYVSCRTKFYS